MESLERWEEGFERERRGVVDNCMIETTFLALCEGVSDMKGLEAVCQNDIPGWQDVSAVGGVADGGVPGGLAQSLLIG